MRSIGDELDAATARPRFLASLFAAMAGVALAIVGVGVGVGVYAVTGSVVAARRKDIGIQRALGASNTRIVAFVAWKVLVPMALGGVAGMSLSTTGVGWLERVVLEGHAASASIYVLAGAATLAAAVLAIWRPVRRAIGIAPQTVIRSDT